MQSDWCFSCFPKDQPQFCSLSQKVLLEFFVYFICEVKIHVIRQMEILCEC